MTKEHFTLLLAFANKDSFLIKCNITSDVLTAAHTETFYIKIYEKPYQKDNKGCLSKTEIYTIYLKYDQQTNIDPLGKFGFRA